MCDGCVTGTEMEVVTAAETTVEMVVKTTVGMGVMSGRTTLRMRATRSLKRWVTITQIVACAYGFAAAADETGAETGEVMAAQLAVETGA